MKTFFISIFCSSFLLGMNPQIEATNLYEIEKKLELDSFSYATAVKLNEDYFLTIRHALPHQMNLSSGTYEPGVFDKYDDPSQYEKSSPEYLQRAAMLITNSEKSNSYIVEKVENGYRAKQVKNYYNYYSEDDDAVTLVFTQEMPEDFCLADMPSISQCNGVNELNNFIFIFIKLVNNGQHFIPYAINLPKIFAFCDYSAHTWLISKLSVTAGMSGALLCNKNVDMFGVLVGPGKVMNLSEELDKDYLANHDIDSEGASFSFAYWSKLDSRVNPY
jgi:hypothetical protein